MLGVEHIMEISKKDWKLYQIKLGKWQENYIDRLNQEYITLLSNKEKAPSEKILGVREAAKKGQTASGCYYRCSKINSNMDHHRSY